MTETPDCSFCEIVAGRARATVIREWPDAIAFRPRSGGVHAGHLLVIPKAHVPHAAADPTITGMVSARAAELMAAYSAANLIASMGPEATLTVEHLHIHVVPRERGDGLSLPWTATASTRSAP